MRDIDLNLLAALDVLLQERSVTRAAHRLRLSISAMSRTLSRLREALGDPVLVPAGRAMVLTPHAEAIADQVRTLTAGAQAVLRPPVPIDPRNMEREFTMRANEAFTQLYAAKLSAAVSAVAPGVRLRFLPKPDKDIGPLRDGTVDLEIGVISGDGGELRAQTLYRDTYVGIARAGHPLFDAPVTPERLCAWGHVVFARRRGRSSPADEALAARGLSRRVSVIVPGFPAVIAVVSASDFLGLVPRSACLALPGYKTALFDLPIAMPEIVVSQIWHPRMDGDAGHRWLRAMVFESFRKGP
ncbi:LysR family transcriptional regulator [Mesorhizobium sp. BAC0120]|uniref:LysR family transcriptional regulator n=1 Tax=Mesorhizobium sp. BAC0120 TaxID=3090670 RepID=UPI00298D113E|nr:LysR family transcriptional regulator [Mesorhizobium sp. BAC0120]MDW6023352.1 LysR family transcriptional regulator [Mesorhizobium sp. BAC0120]